MKKSVTVLSVIVALMIVIGCSGNNQVKEKNDYSPAQAINLKAEVLGPYWIKLSWDVIDTADVEIRFASSTINESNYQYAATAKGKFDYPVLDRKEYTVIGLTSATKYYFALVYVNGASNDSVLLDIAAATTGPVALFFSPDGIK